MCGVGIISDAGWRDDACGCDPMKVKYIEAFDLNSAWYQTVKACMEDGFERPVFRGSRQGASRKELDYLNILVTNPGHRPLIPDVPEGIPPPTSLKYVNEYLGYLMTPFKDDLEDYTYGERMTSKIDISKISGAEEGHINLDMVIIDRIEGARMSEDIDQLGTITEFLKNTPGTNRSIITIGRDRDLALTHPPCMRLLQFKGRYGKLHLSLYFRSWDIWGGFPSNLAALQLMKEHIAKEAGLDDGVIIAASMGAHVYNGEWEIAEAISKGGTGRRVTIE